MKTKWILLLYVAVTLLLMYWLLDSAFFQWLDIRLARRANAFIGLSRQYDMLVGFLADGPGDVLGGLIVVLLFLRARIYRKSSSSNGGTLLASVAFLTFASILTYKVADVAQAQILRPSPATDLDNFRSLRELYSLRIDLADDHSFPSVRATMYFLVFGLAAGGLGRRTFPLLLVALIFCAARLLAGAEWLTSILGGATVGIAMALLFRVPLMRAAYAMLESKSERFYRHNIDVFLYAITARAIGRLANLSDKPNPTENGVAKPLSEELQHFAEKHWNLNDVRLFKRPYKTKIYPIESAQGRYALKVSRHTERHLERNTRKLEIIEELAKRGSIQMPLVLRTQDGEFWKLYDGRLSCLMEWMEGRHPDYGDREDIKRVIQLLSVLHNESADLSMAPIEATTPSQVVKAHLTSQREEAAIIINEMLPQFGMTSIKEITQSGSTALVAEELVRSEMLARTGLIYVDDQTAGLGTLCYRHGDTHPANFLLRDDGSTVMIDFDLLRPGHGYQDLISPLRKFLRRYQWHFDYFDEILQPYLALRPMARFELCLLFAGLVHPDRLLKRFKFKPGRNQDKPVAMRLWRDDLLYATLMPLRQKFFQEAAVRYEIPELAFEFHQGLPEHVLQASLKRMGAGV